VIVTEENNDVVFLDLKTNTQERKHRSRHTHIAKDNNKLLTSSPCTKNGNLQTQLPFVDRCINIKNHVLLSILASFMVTNIDNNTDVTIYNTNYIHICIFYILYIILIQGVS
jgi:hypothetical protein